MGQHTARTDTDGDRTKKAAGRVECPDSSTAPEHLDRRGALQFGTTATLGISALSLPVAAAAVSVDPATVAAPEFIVEQGGEVGTNGVTHTTIQSAVDVASSGARIEVRAGTYEEEAITGSKHLELIGGGSADTVIIGSITFGPTVGTAAVLTGASSRIQGFAFKRPDAILSTDSTYKMVAARGNGHTVVITDNAFDLQAGATETPTRGRGAALSGSASWSVTGNNFLYQTYGGDYESRTLFFENAGPSVIRDNEFSGGHSVFLTGSEPMGSQILSNRFVGGQSITLGTPAGVAIRGNDFEGGTVVYLDSNPGALIRNNRFTSAVIFFVGPSTVAEFTANDISFAGYPSSFGPPFGGNTVFNGAAGITLDARENWWGSSAAPTTVADEAPYDNPVSVAPRIIEFEAGPAASGFRADRGFWPTDIVLSDLE